MVWITRDLEEISKVGVRDTGKTSEFRFPNDVPRSGTERGGILAELKRVLCLLQCWILPSERSSRLVRSSR